MGIIQWIRHGPTVPSRLSWNAYQSNTPKPRSGIWWKHGMRRFSEYGNVASRNICFQRVASMVCPSGLEENLQGQEYGISAMQGAELNLPAGGLGRHHYGHTPRWPGAQHMMGCWEYTAMRPLACRKSEMKLVDLLESIENLPQKIVPRSRVTVLFNIETISWTKWEVITCQRLTMVLVPSKSHCQALPEQYMLSTCCLHGLP